MVQLEFLFTSKHKIEAGPTVDGSLSDRDMQLLAERVGTLPESSGEWRRAVHKLAAEVGDALRMEWSSQASSDHRLRRYPIPVEDGVNKFRHHHTIGVADARAAGRLLTGQGLRGEGYGDGQIEGEQGWCLLCDLQVPETIEHVAFDCPWYEGARLDSRLGEWLNNRDPIIFQVGAPWPGPGGWSALRRAIRFWGDVWRRRKEGRRLTPW